MVRYYFGSSMVKPLVQAKIGWLTGDSKYTSTALNSDSKTSGINYGGGLGVGIFVSQSVALDCILGYSYTSNKSTDSNSNKTTQKTGSFDITIGFTFCL
jgi:opacity protein-like surface antigen